MENKIKNALDAFRGKNNSKEKQPSKEEQKDSKEQNVQTIKTSKEIVERIDKKMVMEDGRQLLI